LSAAVFFKDRKYRLSFAKTLKFILASTDIFRFISTSAKTFQAILSSIFGLLPLVLALGVMVRSRGKNTKSNS
jgi:hypothetical protein